MRASAHVARVVVPSLFLVVLAATGCRSTSTAGSTTVPTTEPATVSSTVTPSTGTPTSTSTATTLAAVETSTVTTTVTTTEVSTSVTTATVTTLGPADRGAIPVVSGDEGHVVHVELLPTSGCRTRPAADGRLLPDPTCTPGAIAARVTPENLATTICRSGYTATVRPPASETTPLKLATAAAYGITVDRVHDEYDHLIPLELGGANDVRNLWDEPETSSTQKGTANAKDPVETHLHTLVCKGTISLAEAQRRIATDWTTALAGLP